MASKLENLDPGARRGLGVVILAVGLVCAVTPFRDLQRRRDVTWAEVTPIQTPACTTYNLVLTWCSATVGVEPNTRSVHHVHLLPPGFYDMFGEPSPLKTEKGRLNFGLIDPRDGYVTTLTTLSFAGARLGSALLLAAIGLWATLYWSWRMRGGSHVGPRVPDPISTYEPDRSAAGSSPPSVGAKTFGRRQS